MITDFTTLNDAMAETIKASLEPVQTAEAMSEDVQDGMITPAVFLDLAEMSKGRKLSDKRMPWDCTFMAYCVLSTKTERALLEVRNFAAAVADVIETHGKWGLDGAVSRPAIASVSPGVFERNGQGFECMVVEFTQTVYVGEGWKPGAPCTDVYLAGCHDELHYLGRVDHVHP